MDKNVKINEQLSIPVVELQFHFARSGGKGGQNVNKVETKVELFFDVANSPSLSENERVKILKHLHTRIDMAGMLRIVAQEHRSQWKNREHAVQRFVMLLKEALKHRKKRIATKATRAAKEKRLDEKKRRSKIKQLRKIDRE